MILIFGKTGQIATELGTFDGIKALGRDDADLSEPIACANAIRRYKPQVVINAAAYTAVDKAENEGDLAFVINGRAPGAMAMACAELTIPLVHISTEYVFDGTGSNPWQISDTPKSNNVYGRSKLLGEKSIMGSGCIYAIVRTSWVVSAHGNNFVKNMMRLSETKDRISVVNDQVGGPTCARDVAHTSISIAKQLIQSPNKTGIYHYCGQPDVSWSDFANAIFSLTSSKAIVDPISSNEYPTPASRPCNSRLDCTVTKNVFGIDRPYWREGLKQIIKDLENANDKA